MGSKWIWIGFLFLINPELLTLDPLPDFIGYLLIGKGLYQLSFLEERLFVARRYAHFLAAASAVQLVSVPMSFASRIETDRLTVSFFFFVVELTLALVFCGNAFRGFQYLAIRKDSDLSLKGYDVAKLYLTVFFVLKYVTHFLPQAAVIFFADVDADPDLVENYTQLQTSFRTTRSVLFLLGAVVLVALGIYAARILKAYLARIRSDEAFCLRLRESYAEKVTKSNSMQIRLAIRESFRWFFAAFFFLFEFDLDGIGIFPTFLFPLLLCFGFFRLKRAVPVGTWCIPVSAAASVFGVAAYAYRVSRYYALGGNFFLRFSQEPLAWILAVGTVLLTAASAFLLFSRIHCCAASYTTATYRTPRILLSVFTALALGMSGAIYLYPGQLGEVTFALVAVTLWLLYYHKKTADEIRDEADYKLM